MRDDFGQALACVLADEGGYVCDPHDSGGATNHGVTARVYRAYRAAKRLPARSIMLIAPEEISDIYHGQYAHACSFDALPRGVDYAVLDIAINAGPAAAARLLRRALGLPATGAIDAGVLAHARSVDPLRLIDALSLQRLALMQRLRAWRFFARGWRARVARVRVVARGMAAARP